MSHSLLPNTRRISLQPKNLSSSSFSANMQLPCHVPARYFAKLSLSLPLARHCVRASRKNFSTRSLRVCERFLPSIHSERGKHSTSFRLLRRCAIKKHPSCSVSFLLIITDLFSVPPETDKVSANIPQSTRYTKLFNDM